MNALWDLKIAMIMLIVLIHLARLPVYVEMVSVAMAQLVKVSK